MTQNLIDLLRWVSKGQVSAEELAELRAKYDDGTPFMKTIFDDADDAVIHLPAQLFRGKIELEEMHATFEGGMVLVYILLFANGISAADAIRFREILWDSGTSPKTALELLGIVGMKGF